MKSLCSKYVIKRSLNKLGDARKRNGEVEGAERDHGTWAYLEGCVTA